MLVLSKHQAAPEAALNVPATRGRSSGMAPKTSPALGPGQPSSISNAFLKRKRRRLTKFRSPYTAPPRRSPGGSTQPSAACSDPKARRGFRAKLFLCNRSSACDIPNLRLIRPQKLLCIGCSLKLLMALLRGKKTPQNQTKKNQKQQNNFGKECSPSPRPGGRCSRLKKSLQCTISAPPLPATEVLL